MREFEERPADPAHGPSVLRRLKDRILPSTPDFYQLLIEQCDITVEGTSTLVEFLQANDASLGKRVRTLEHEGDRLKARNLEILHRSFSTPMDRDDFYRAVESVDEILNYAKTTVVEMEILRVTADAHMAEMAGLVDAGCRALRKAAERLQRDPDAAGVDARSARKSERRAEKAYRRALAELFDPQLLLRRLPAAGAEGVDSAVLPVGYAETFEVMSEVFKRREVYRHLSNAADHVANAGQVLEDIVNKAT
jgi:uncharacterized protein Yka (UPF0111/DUF47 family)